MNCCGLMVLKQHPVIAHSSVGYKSGWLSFSLDLESLQDWNQDIVWAGLYIDILFQVPSVSGKLFISVCKTAVPSLSWLSLWTDSSCQVSSWWHQSLFLQGQQQGSFLESFCDSSLFSFAFCNLWRRTLRPLLEVLTYHLRGCRVYNSAQQRPGEP